MSESPAEAYIHCKEEASLQNHLVSVGEWGPRIPVVAFLMAQGWRCHRARGVTNCHNDRGQATTLNTQKLGPLL